MTAGILRDFVPLCETKNRNDFVHNLFTKNMLRYHLSIMLLQCPLRVFISKKIISETLQDTISPDQ